MAGEKTIEQLMGESGVGFGTSGARGRVVDMTDRVCYAYTLAFLQYLQSVGEAGSGRVAIAGDFRASSPRIITACMRAVMDAGFDPVHCGFIPTPAVTLFGMAEKIPSLMVTGSHIPDDRNGIKFNKPTGEILKRDERAIQSQQIIFPQGLFDDDGMLVTRCYEPAIDRSAYAQYVQRYVDFFPAQALEGMHIGIYEHSTVARDALNDIFTQLGAKVTPLGRSEHFIPVDTEAVREEDVRLAKRWAEVYDFDAIVSADGDGDRPLVSDAKGQWLRGDVAGILCARSLGATDVVTPVSSNSAVEKCGWFDAVLRTRIGSPYVIEKMNEVLQEKPESTVVGYEANGGFLTATGVVMGQSMLSPLPTRDAVIVPLMILMLARRGAITVEALLSSLPQRFTFSDRIKDFPTELSRAKIGTLRDAAAIEALFGDRFGRVQVMDETDGLRITFTSDEVVHLRPSGNAPELRCYNEASSAARALEMNQQCLTFLHGWRGAK
ncbi:MAG: phosphomannomutase [Zetaproteobacteria bacterium]|nr:phosphomannomutase [Zetaproteobacteria bacterium]